MAANGDLLNALEKERRRRARESSLDRVEEAQPGRNEVMEDPSAATALEHAERDTIATAALAEAIRTVITDPRDRQLASLIIEGERATAAYARVLGIEHQEQRAQERDVKRHKNRLKKRLERLGARLRE